MNRDAAFLFDIYEAVKTYISKAELSMVAEDLVRIFDEYGFTDGFDDPTLNTKLKTAIKQFYGDEDDVIDEEELNFDDNYGGGYGDYDD